jgi:GH24 family phage-related lysozyme (muramidase)
VNFKEFFLRESVSGRLKALGVAGVLALSPATPSDAQEINFQPTSSISIENNDFIKKAAKFIEKNEGKVNRLYKDHKGNWTIGIGHLVLPHELDMFKGRVLSENEILELFRTDINKKLVSINRRFGSVYNTYSDNLKIAILDGFFRGDLSGSPKTINLLKQRKFKEASKEYLNNQEYFKSKQQKTGVYKRMERNAQFMADESS